MERNQRQIRLENILGFNGNSDNVLKTLTGQYESVLVYAIGGLLVLEQHQTGGQRYLKIHDMPITAIAVSPRSKSKKQKDSSKSKKTSKNDYFVNSLLIMF